jgi:hypoxanthine-DNA glycosylase
MVMLHEEIRAVLLTRSRQMATQEIADEVNRRGNYRKRNGSAVTAFQVHGRTRNYSDIFTREGSRVGLVEWLAGKVTDDTESPPRRRKAVVPSLTPLAERRRSGSASAVQALQPEAGSDARLLILGTMPGPESLRLRQYYANPRNQFWRILSESFNREVPDSYRDRISLLIANHIALWDVLEICEREGALDSKIVLRSEQPNDVAGFLREHRGITTIALNGGAAAKYFQRFVAPQLMSLADRPLKLVQLPSTSSAHTIPVAAKLSQWRPILVAAA